MEHVSVGPSGSRLGLLPDVHGLFSLHIEVHCEKTEVSSQGRRAGRPPFVEGARKVPYNSGKLLPFDSEHFTFTKQTPKESPIPHRFSPRFKHGQKDDTKRKTGVTVVLLRLRSTSGHGVRVSEGGSGTTL